MNDDAIQGFHSADYLDFMKGDVNNADDETNEEYGFGNKTII